MTVAQGVAIVAVAIVILLIVWLVLRERQRWRRIRFGVFIEREDGLEHHRLTAEEFDRWLQAYALEVEGRPDDVEGDA